MRHWPDRFEQRLEYAAIGSVTNLASRLCDEAKANQIVVSGASTAWSSHGSRPRDRRSQSEGF